MTTTRPSREILQLRAERAKLLGYPTHAHWRLENSMAKTPERAMELMEAGLEAGRGARSRRSCRHAGAGGQRRREDQDRALGLSLLRGESSQGPVRSGSERSEAISATGEVARGHLLGCRRTFQLQLHARDQRSGRASGHSRLGSHRQNHEATHRSYGISIHMRAQASGRARG